MFSVPSNSPVEVILNWLKNCTFKFTFEKQIKSHLFASQSKQFLIIKANSFKSTIYEYISPYLVFPHTLELSLPD